MDHMWASQPLSSGTAGTVPSTPHHALLSSGLPRRRASPATVARGTGEARTGRNRRRNGQKTCRRAAGSRATGAGERRWDAREAGGIDDDENPEGGTHQEDEAEPQCIRNLGTPGRSGKTNSGNAREPRETSSGRMLRGEDAEGEGNGGQHWGWRGMGP